MLKHVSCSQARFLSFPLLPLPSSLCQCVCVRVYTLVHLYDARRKHYHPLSLPTCPLRQGLSLNLELVLQARLEYSKPKWSCCLHPTLSWGSRCVWDTWLVIWVLDLNSRPHDYTGSSLTYGVISPALNSLQMKLHHDEKAREMETKILV